MDSHVQKHFNLSATAGLLKLGFRFAIYCMSESLVVATLVYPVEAELSVAAPLDKIVKIIHVKNGTAAVTVGNL